MKTNNHQTSPLRSRLRPAALLSALALGLGIFPALAAPPYMEVGGRAVIEAEHFSTNTPAANGKYWHLVPDQDNPAANLPNFIHTLTTAHGGKYMMVLPDNGQNLTTTANWNSGPWLDFVVRISTPGTYRLWLRWRGWDGGNDSMYAQILGLGDGIGGTTNDWYNYFGNSGNGFNGQWRGSAVPEVVNAAGTLVNASWDINTPGDYTIRLTYREDGCSVDKICLQLESLANPTDAGPPESPILQDNPFIWSRTPAAGATAIFPTTAYQAQIRDGGLVALSATDPIFLLNGTALPFTKSKTGAITTLDAASQGLLPSGSSNTLTVIYQDANTVSYTNTWQFVASTPAVIPAGFKMAAGQVNTAAPGFLANIHQAVTFDTNTSTVVYNVTFANSADRAEGQLRGYFTDPATGLPYTNNFGAGTRLFPESFIWGDGADENFALPETWLNFDITPFLSGAADTGNFQYDANAPDGNGMLDVYFPGYGPRFDPFNTFNIAAEFITYLDLPAGLTRLGVNSDDGFMVSCGLNPRERYDASKVIVLGRFDGGRGSSDTLFDIMVEEAGLYPIRVLWYQGNGGADMEFFSVKPDGSKVLINDIAATPRLGDPASIRAYRSTVTPLQLSAVVDLLQPAPNAQNVATNAGLQVQLGDSATATVNQGSIHLYLNAAEVTPVKTVSAPRTVLNYTPVPALAEGSTNTARIEFADSLGNSITQSWTFVTAITVAGPAQGELVRKIWLGVTGTTVASLTTWADFINNANYNPNGEPGIINTFEQAQFPGTVDNYGQQFLGYIRPAATDWYTFYLGSDDNSVLRLGTNDQPSSLRQIAVQAGYNGNREFVSARNTYARRSVPILLEAGQRYFFEALHKEGGGGDNFAVAWWRSNTPPIVNGSAPISGPVLERFVGAAYSRHPQPVTTTKGNPVNLSAAAYIGLGTVSYQWYKGAGTVAGANALTLTMDPSTVADSGTYKLRITVDGVNYDSNEALVTVLDDNTPPAVVGPGVGMNDAVLAAAGGPGHTVAINFNEAISAASAQSATVTVSGGNTVAELSVGGTGNSVLLLKLSGVLPANFTVTLSGLTDVAGNTIAANTVVNSTLNSYTPMVLGTPGADPVDLSGTVAYGLGDNDFIVIANGSDLWGSADAGHFLYTQRTGNFDAQVRLESLTQANAWSKAGIMAREDLTPGSRNNMILATPLPANNLYNHQWRDVADAASGSKPDPRPTGVSYPNAWVRLTREGNTFSAYIKTNGVDWVLINEYIPPTAYPDQLYVGLATTSHDNIPGDLTTAVYRDFEISSLSVVTPPQIQSTGIGTDGNIVLNFSAALSQTYTVLASTNIAQPLNQWSIVAQGTVTASPVTVSDLNSTNYPTRFYLISIP